MVLFLISLLCHVFSINHVKSYFNFKLHLYDQSCHVLFFFFRLYLYDWSCSFISHLYNWSCHVTSRFQFCTALMSSVMSSLVLDPTYKINRVMSNSQFWIALVQPLISCLISILDHTCTIGRVISSFQFQSLPIQSIMSYSSFKSHMYDRSCHV